MSTPTRNETPVRWLSVGEAAARLGVSNPTVRRWVKTGHLHGAQPGGEQGVMRIPEDELRRLAGHEDSA
jgi:excisionase family DNA binding protein